MPATDYVSQFGPKLMELDSAMRAPPGQDPGAIGDAPMDQDGEMDGALPGDASAGGALPDQQAAPAPDSGPSTLPVTLKDHLATYTDQHFKDANDKLKAETGKSLNEQYDELAKQGMMPHTSKELTDRQKSELMIHFGLSMMQHAANRPAIITPQNIGDLKQGGFGADIADAGQSTLAMSQGMQQQNQAQAAQQQAAVQKVELAKAAANKDLALKMAGGEQQSNLQSQKDQAALQRTQITAGTKQGPSAQHTTDGLVFDPAKRKYYDPDGKEMSAKQVRDWHAQAAAERTTATTKARIDVTGQKSFGALQDADTNEAIAQQVASGNIAPPTGRNAYTPMGMYVMKRAAEINPSFSGASFPTTQAAMKAFASGEPSKKVRSLNVAISHLGTLDGMIDGLQNGNMQTKNQFKQFIKKEFGAPEGTSFDAVAGMVGKEIVNAVIAGGGGEREREEVTGVFSKIKSPAQLHDAVQKYLPLLGGQMEGLHRQYISGTNGRKDFEKFLEPQTKKVLGFIDDKNAKTADNSDTGSDKLPTISSQADYETFRKSNPPGTKFIGPDGKTWTTH